MSTKTSSIIMIVATAGFLVAGVFELLAGQVFFASGAFVLCAVFLVVTVALARTKSPN